MPCNGGSPAERDREYEREFRRQKAAIDVLTRRLCHACQLLLDALQPLPAELDEWFFEYNIKDAARINQAKRQKESEDRVQNARRLGSELKEK